ncbi:hypothetical protein OE88DRAFT_1736519 [Heliocybe sulcata]|uniref:Uncharacterized protein n=1 Tax=Heliocybe sulcata TaxID=5364 RepID=A0A5C3N8X6_9AGAM|nr:hypothetical protein OE88DRAFT_1736519 [Heliocybe sulcata]
MTQTLGSSSLGGGDAIFLPKNKKPYTTEHLARLACLSREQKAEFNRLISVRNASRIEKESRRESDNLISPASSVESLIDIPEEEDAPSRPSTPKNGNKFQATMHMLASLSPTVFDRVIGFVPSKRKASDDSDLEELSDPKRPKLLTTEGETKITPGATVCYLGVHPEIELLIKHKQHLRLSLFTNDGLRKLVEDGNTMPRKKLASKISIIDVSQFKDEALLTKDEFREAIDRAMMVFTVLGDASYIQRWDDHWSWFLNLPNFKDNFDAVLACEIELRREYRTSPFEFNPIHYNTRYRSKLADLQLAQMKQLERDMRSLLGGRSSGQGAGPSRNSGPQVNGRRFGGVGIGMGAVAGGAGAGGAGGRFPEGNGGAGPVPVCLICSHKGHLIWNCTAMQFPDGAPLFSETRGCNLHPRGGVEEICRIWNITRDVLNRCNHHVNDRDNRLHCCSFRGVHDHHALSWTCRNEPRN